jgi:hypothetical protein
MSSLKFLKTGILGLGALIVVNSAFAQQEFALVGVWQRTDNNGVMTIAFNPDHTFLTRFANPPAANGMGSGMSQWRGQYRPTSASSWIAKIVAIQICASGGGCNSCPASPQDLPAPPNYGCEMAKAAFGITLGVQEEQGWKLQAPNQAVDQWGGTWRRIR